MATSQLTNTAKDPNGTAVAGVTVTARLRPGAGFRTADSSEITPIESTTSDAAGAWTLTLERTADITPSGSWWEIEEAFGDSHGGPRVWAATVGSANANLLASLLTAPPAGPTPSQFLTQTAGDARYRAVATAIVSADIADGAIVDADVSASAGIAQSKVANLTADLAAKVAKAASRPVRTITVADALVAADAAGSVEVNSASTVAVTIPPDVFSVGAEVHIAQRGAGQVTLTPGAGVTIEGSTSTPSQHSTLVAHMRAANVWRVGVTAPNGTYVGRLAGTAGSVAVLPFINVKDYGAVGDGVTDDTAAIQAAIAACHGSGAVSTVRPVTRSLWVPGGTYKTTAPLTIKSVQGFRLMGAGRDITTFTPTGTLDSFLDIDGCANGTFGGFTVTPTGGITDKVIALDWTNSVTVGRSTTNNSFRDINVNGSFKWGFAIGTRSANLQVDQTSFYSCLVTGTRVSGAADTTHSQEGYRCGSGTFGNILSHFFYDCSAVLVKIGFSVQATTGHVVHTQPVACDVDFWVAGSGSALSVSGLRSEGATRLLETSGGSALTKITLSDIRWRADNLNADQYWLYVNGCAQLTVTNCAVTNATITPQMFINGPGGVGISATFVNLDMPCDIASIGFMSAGANVVFINYAQTDASDIIVTSTPLLVRKSSTEHLVVDTVNSITKVAGDLSCVAAGKGLRVKEGSNAKQGVSTLVAGTVVVSNTSVTATSRILLTVQSLGTVTAPKAIAVTARTAGTSFTITSADATDTSVVGWQIFEPA